MTQTLDIPDVLNRLDKLTAVVEATNASIQAVDKKLDVFIARTDERFNSIDQRFQALDQRITDLDKSLGKRIDTLEQRNIAQDVRFWGFLGVVVTALLGLLSKLAFFPAA
jgi:tetrahydromethanopterin S-methyltransferase subunit B